MKDRKITHRPPSPSIPRSPRPERRHLDRLTQILDAGIVMVRPDLAIDHVSPEALRLLDLDGRDDPRWDEVRSHFDDALARSREEEHVTTEIEIEPRQPEIAVTGSGSLELRRRLRLEIHSYEEMDESIDDQRSGADCTGYLVLIHELRIVQSLEKDLAQAVRLRALTRLYMGTAHDLRAPMNAMALNLELLRDSLGRDADDELRGKQKRWVGVIGEELERLQRSLDALLEQTAPAREAAERFDLARAIVEIEDLVVAQTRQQSVVLERLERDESDGAVWVEGLRDRIKQAVLTLVVNALEALDPGGRLRLDLETADGEAAVRVVDTGPGIPRGLQQRIFDMRFTTKESGTGVGLHVARGIAEHHGGTLRLLESGEDGSTFELRLPLSETTETE